MYFGMLEVLHVPDLRLCHNSVCRVVWPLVGLLCIQQEMDDEHGALMGIAVGQTPAPSPIPPSQIPHRLP